MNTLVILSLLAVLADIKTATYALAAEMHGVDVYIPATTPTQSPEAGTETTTAEKEVRRLIGLYSDRYGVKTDAMIELAKCESGLKKDAWNKNDPGVGSKGIFQYQEPTFYGVARELGIANPDIWNVEQQAELTAYLLSKNKSFLWTCARKSDRDYIK